MSGAAGIIVLPSTRQRFSGNVLLVCSLFYKENCPFLYHRMFNVYEIPQCLY